MVSKNTQNRQRRLWMPVGLLSMTLAACSTIQTTVTRTECVSFAPITFSVSMDTLETIRQVREHNAAWEALCNK